MQTEASRLDVEDELASGASIPPVLARWTATLLHRSSQQMRERFEERVAHLGLRSKHYGVLMLVESSPQTQVDIGRNLWVDRTTMVSLIDDLMRLDLVGRARHPEDRRAYAVTITDKGREYLQLATDAADATEDECFAGLTTDERLQLRTLLSKVLSFGSDGAV